MSNYRILKLEGRAKRAEFQTVHGTIQTPVFMNVGTAAAIKGRGVHGDLEGIGTQVELSNTYHLHVRPGDEVVKKMGGIHRFMSWNRAGADGFRRIPGVFPGYAEGRSGRGRHVPFACGRQEDLHGAGGKHADTVQSGLHDCHGL